MIDAKEKYMKAILEYLSKLNIVEKYNLTSNTKLFDLLLNYTGYKVYNDSTNLYCHKDVKSMYYLFDNEVALVDSNVIFTDLEGNNHNTILVCINKSKNKMPIINVMCEKCTTGDITSEKIVGLIDEESGFYYEKKYKNDMSFPILERYSDIYSSNSLGKTNLANILVGKNINPHEIVYEEGVPMTVIGGNKINASELIDNINKKIDASLKYIDFEIGFVRVLK